MHQISTNDVRTTLLSGKATKVDINRPEGLDDLLNAFQDGPPVVVADMGAGAGQVAYKGFDDMYDGAKELGVALTAMGFVTPDPATVDSVVKWANALQDRTDYLIMKKAVNNPSDFGASDGAKLAEKFRNKLSPKVIEIEFHMPSVKFAARNHGLTLGDFGILNLLAERTGPSSKAAST